MRICYVVRNSFLRMLGLNNNTRCDLSSIHSPNYNNTFTNLTLLTKTPPPLSKLNYKLNRKTICLQVFCTQTNSSQ